MTRALRTYGERTAQRAFTGLDVESPVAGFYKMRLRSGAVFAVVKVWFGPPNDPVTGEPLDRSWRWQAHANGELIPFEQAWPACARIPATEDDYRRAIQRQRWAQENAPGTAYADPRAKYDPLSSPLPF